MRMKITRGLHVEKFRSEVSLQTLDAESHSFITKNAEVFDEVLTRYADGLRVELQAKLRELRGAELVALGLAHGDAPAQPITAHGDISHD
jgi:hypothetical protein